MADNQFNPGSADVTEAIMISHDGKEQNITAQIVSFSLSQSMDTSYSGTLTLLDSISLLEGFPIRGEETIQIRIIGHDYGTEVNLKVHVYSIDNIQPSESTSSVLFNMNFVSNISYNASRRRIIKAYTNKSLDTISQFMFHTYFAKLGAKDTLDPQKERKLLFNSYRLPIIEEPERSFIVQPTANMTDCIIPNMIPTEAMDFIAKQSYQPETPSCSFRFFETLDNYYYATDEYFIKTAETRDLRHLFYSPAASNDQRNPSDLIERIDDLTIMNKGLNTAADMFSGAYRNKTTEIDLIRRKINVRQWGYDKNAKYIDMSGNPRDTDDDTHTSSFREDTFTEENAKDFLIFKDYQQNGDIPSTLHTDRFISEIVGNRISYKHHLNKTMLGAKMKGRLDLRPGMLVNLSIKNLDGVDNAKRNSTLSGRYLINTVNHNRDDKGTLHCGLVLQKFGWSRGDIDV